MTTKKTIYLTADGKEEVKFGDNLYLHEEKQTKFGTLKREEVITVTEASIPHLLKRGVIISKEVENTTENLVAKIINKFANHLGCTKDEAVNFLGLVYMVNSTAFYNMVFKKFALEFDKAYSDHISKAKELWFISSMDFKVRRVGNKEHVNFKNFAAFRTPEDAAEAVKLANIIAAYFDEQ